MSLIILLITSSSGLRSAEPGSFCSILHDPRATFVEADLERIQGKGQKDLSKEERVAYPASGTNMEDVTLLVNRIFMLDERFGGKVGSYNRDSVLAQGYLLLTCTARRSASPILVSSSLLVK
jgi:hypothetical protein